MGVVVLLCELCVRVHLCGRQRGGGRREHGWCGRGVGEASQEAAGKLAHGWRTVKGWLCT